MTFQYLAESAAPNGVLTGLEVLLLLLVLFLSFMIWALTRHVECRFSGEPPEKITDQLPAIAGTTHSELIEGNKVELLQDEEFFNALCSLIENARDTIHIETFLWKDGRVSDRVMEALEASLKRNVRVRILIDARGSKKFSSQHRERLRRAGAELKSFHRMKLRNLGRFNIRDHRKIVVIDGSAALIGGHCIHDGWTEKGEEGNPGARGYRDISGLITGPVVARIQSAFFENWQEVTGEVFTDDTTFPKLEPEGNIPAHLAYISADGCPSSVQTLHYLAIGFAKKTIRIQNPYFLPDPRGIEALAKAVDRGVDVRIMTPAVKASDTPYVQRAGQVLYGDLLRAGVRIFEYQPTLLHQKVITIDGEWCGFGSSNFDDRSFAINDEATLGISDPATTAILNETFEKDARDCEELTLETWKERAWPEQLFHRVHYLFREQL
ncbi:phospholipase D-like domain-containing protein [Verrucomicrobiales bacterium BCK34]|nr:phospholipase D-like domain-containing protein [Verrucomicrobiales bacterium BCK34]